MGLEFERTERQFSASEVAEFFGVPEVTQRDWRRRFPDDFRPAEKGKKFLFTLSEACTLALTKVQTDAGKAVSGALWTSKMSSLAAIEQIELCQLGVKFEGIDLTSAEKRQLILQLNELEDREDSATRYLFFPVKDQLNSTIDGKPPDGPTCYHFRSLAHMEGDVVRDWVYGSIFDLQGFAMSLSFGMSEPMVTYRLIEGNE